MCLLQNGLSDPDRPDFGGWGGRHKLIYDPEARHYHDAVDRVASEVDGSMQMSAAASIWRWRSAVQNDFASRMRSVSRPQSTPILTSRWTLDDTDSIERPPIIIVDGDDSLIFIERQCKVSEILEFDASQSSSPHGAKLSFKWFQYKEIGSVLPIVSVLRIGL